MSEVKLLQGDCLELMKGILDESVDLILCDLPYGITSCKWDSILNLDELWSQYNRIIKDNGAIILTSCQPFTTSLIASNMKGFKCEWIYKKRCASNFAQAKYMPMREHESVLVFSKGGKRVNYYPIKEARTGGGLQRSKYAYSSKSRLQYGEFIGGLNGSTYNPETDAGNDKLRYPSSVQEFNNRAKGDIGYHPTQKPVAMLEYFIKTYSREGDLVLDSCMGSGSTGVACVNTNRNFIGMELEDKYFKVAENRIYGQIKGC